jgi:2-methylcitrate dehydratase
MARMTAHTHRVPDKLIADIATYAGRYRVKSPLAVETAHYCLIDSLGCGFEALGHPACNKLLGPAVPGTVVPHGARVPGTPFVLDPVQAAFNIGALVRWLDFNDTFFGETVTHPSDSIGAILAVADWLSRTRVAQGKPPLLMHEVLEDIVKAYEITGGMALQYNIGWELGIDVIILIKIACAAVVTRMLGGSHDEIVNAVSNAFIDGHPLILYRRKGNTGSRKSWAAADAASRGVWLALMAVKGEMGYPTALTAKTWGFYDVLAEGRPFKPPQPFGTYAVENVQFKIAYPAAFHMQTAVEAAILLHKSVQGRIDEIEKIELWVHEHTFNYLSRTGPLRNYAERDHCPQYVVAIGLIFGNLVAEDYEDARAADPRIDRLREKVVVIEDKAYSRGFLDPRRRSNANAVRVHFRDGTATRKSEVEYPLGHPRRRKQGIPLLVAKFEQNVARVYAEKRRRQIIELCLDRKRLGAMPVNEFMDLLAG